MVDIETSDIDRLHKSSDWYCEGYDNKIVVGCENVRFEYFDEEDNYMWNCNIFLDEKEVDNICVSGFTDTDQISGNLQKLAYIMLYDPPEGLY